MTSFTVIRFPLRLCKADKAALRRIECEDSQIVGARIGAEGEVQVRTLTGEIYNLDAVPKFRARRLAHGRHDPLPPAGAQALRPTA